MRQQYRSRGVESLYHERSSLWRVCGSSILIWNMERELKAPYWNGAKNLISTSVYSIACKFNAPTDMEELHVQKSSDLPNNNLIFRFELHFGYNMGCNRTTPEDPIWICRWAHDPFLINPTFRRRFGQRTGCTLTPRPIRTPAHPCHQNLLRSVWERMGLVLVQAEFFKNQILCNVVP